MDNSKTIIVEMPTQETTILEKTIFVTMVNMKICIGRIMMLLKRELVGFLGHGGFFGGLSTAGSCSRMFTVESVTADCCSLLSREDILLFSVVVLFYS
jgi:hypothetical protein